MKILIIEDHQVVAEGISTMLKEVDFIEKVSKVTAGNTGIDFLQQNPDTDIVLLDINLPDGSGIEFCSVIRQEFPEIGIIALSTFNQAGIINKMIENGADSYLLKNTTSEELIGVIEKVSSGIKYLSPKIKKILNEVTVLKSKTPVLTKREKEVLTWIAEGLTNQEIADKLFISQLTVVSHRKSLLEKTESKNTAQLIKYCFEFGLL
ncbi:MAG: response regulator transcription factor [Flavobacteriaceae bacterium]|jgi:DNA-binding NarL/FixJ family response regulator|nr:response regulator transcription factor [Flavobacteriaceae bacterium]